LFRNLLPTSNLVPISGRSIPGSHIFYNLKIAKSILEMAAPVVPGSAFQFLGENVTTQPEFSEKEFKGKAEITQ